MQTATRLKIAFDDVGDGDPMLLFMPGWCVNRTAFRNLLPLAAKDRRAIALDWRGHGGSERPDGDYTTEDLVDDAIAVIEQSGASTVVPVALAHSGWVAVELLRRLGTERMPGVVLLDWMFLGPPPQFAEVLAGMQDPAHWTEMRSLLFNIWTGDLNMPALDAHIAGMAAYGFDTWSRAAREIQASFAKFGSPAHALEQLNPDRPVLHVYAQPASDEFLAAQRQFAESHGWFQVRRLKAKSHFPMFETSETLMSAIDDFVDKLT